ncbi:gephyrin-like molybdotransferase Glp [Singulisphaera sp. GP187]|uniref:molybdopterin molybdotransferase MoeA n=1 Tax=Singulisphaera sp. GP187 TaxID=1882752 RepID=UPI0009414695|nr:gephyrin-like molybdotransferase Glp [Singulisphaera sp. GP187]
MQGFRDRTQVEDVVALISRGIPRLGVEPVELRETAGRVLGEEIRAEAPVPSFDRAAMDGYALRGHETVSATAQSPVLFRCVGEARPGQLSNLTVGPGETIQITTGSAIPKGADTVVRVESTQRDGPTVRVFQATTVGRHVGRIGEDIEAGTVVLSAGRVLRPQDLGVLSAVGAGTVAVVQRPQVAVIVTGDELVTAGHIPADYQIADMNSGMLAALIVRDGGLPRVVGPLPDDRDRIRAEIAEAASWADVVLVSGGTSTGPEDHVPGIVAELGELAVHGIALRPAGPTGLGFIGGAAVVLLPGNPVSCLCAYDFFAGPIVRLQGGRPRNWPYRPRALPLARPLDSLAGRVDYVRVTIDQGRVEPLAASGASILSSTTRADGFVIVPADLNGYPANALVTVWFYDLFPGSDSDDLIRGTG